MSFNPSYRGIGFWSTFERQFLETGLLFQSFLSWNWLLKKDTLWPTNTSPSSFNPSYRGIGFWRTNSGVIPCVEILSFNPSYRGIGFWSSMDNKEKFEDLKFQSFLSWNWLLKIYPRSFYRALSPRFNPSYRGIGFWSVIVPAYGVTAIWFQSFLSWNWLLK